MNVLKVEIDTSYDERIKLNPPAAWSWEHVWDYIKANNSPYNMLHDRVYPGIGCAPCTRAIIPGKDIRRGRWSWENNSALKEWGLHKVRSAGRVGTKANDVEEGA